MTVIYSNEEIESEIWKPVSGYEGLYEVSNLGRVKSLSRVVFFGHGCKAKKIIPEKILVTSNRNGYRQVSLCLSGKQTEFSVHRIVCTAFHEKPENYTVVNHKNSIKTDNRAINLEWCTHKHNTQEAITSGIMDCIFGENSSVSTISDMDIVNIRKMYASGRYTQREIGKLFGVSQTHVKDIVNFKSRAKPTPVLQPS